MDHQRITETEPFTRLEIANPYGTVAIEIPETDQTLSVFIQDFIRPALLAMGYSEVLVDQYFQRD